MLEYFKWIIDPNNINANIFTLISVILSGIVSWIISAVYFSIGNRNNLRASVLHPVRRLLESTPSWDKYRTLTEYTTDYSMKYLKRKERPVIDELLSAYKDVCRYNYESVCAESLFSYFNYKLKKNGIDPSPIPVYIEDELVEAALIFMEISSYRDSNAKANEIYTILCSTQYAQAEALLLSGDYYGAAVTFGQLGNYEDAQSRSRALWSEIVSDCTLSVGYEHSVAIKENGEIIATGSNEFGQCDVEDWKDIISVSAGWDHTVGLRSDGTVVATGERNDSVQEWENIVAVAAGGYHTVGLKSDGTVIAVGGNSEGQCDVESWKNIIAISAGQRHTVGVCADGTVVATGYNDNGQCNVGDWQDIVYVSANMYRTVGVRSDGTVVAVGDNDHGQGKP